MDTNFYKSQYGQDKIINELFFKNKKNGVFVDVGAHDGVSGSNTYFFEKFLEWEGLCIEPMPQSFEELKDNRKCKLVNGCAYKENGTVIFRNIQGYSDQLSGIIDSYDKKHLERVNHEIKLYGQTYQDIEVISYNLNDLLIENNFLKIDFLSLDVEGSEFEIIKTLDFDKLHFDVLCIENNYQSNDIREYLSKNNYSFHSRIMIDDVFIKI